MALGLAATYSIFGGMVVFTFMAILLAVGWSDIKKKIKYYTHFNTHGIFYWQKPNGLIDWKVLPLGSKIELKGKGKKLPPKIYQYKESRAFNNSTGGCLYYSENKNPINLHKLVKEGKPEFMDDPRVAAAINTLSYDQGYIEGAKADKIGKMVLGAGIFQLLLIGIVIAILMMNGGVSV